MMKLPFSPVVFGEKGIEYYKKWLELSCLDGREVIPITDELTDLPNSVRVDTSEFSFCHPVIKSDFIKASAGAALGRKTIVCDADWIPLMPIPFEDYADAPCAMCRFYPYLVTPELDDLLQGSSGVMIVDINFAELWKKYFPHPFIQSIMHERYWAGEIASSMVFRKLGGVEMPDRFNVLWLYHDDIENPMSIHFFTEEGKEKFKHARINLETKKLDFPR